MSTVASRIAQELAVELWQVEAAIALLDEGATVPFISRYRKEATGALDDIQLRNLAEKLTYMRELDARRQAILESITEQGVLTDALREQLETADTKARLEDIYLPYRPKRRTKAQIAIEAGLGPLADILLASPVHDPVVQAAKFVEPDKGIDNPQAALEGARSILIERFGESADLIGALRETFWRHGVLTAKVRPGKDSADSKYRDYFDHTVAIAKIPAHRMLAIMRGEKEEVLDVRLLPEAEEGSQGYEGRIARQFGIADRGRPGDRWLLDAVRFAWRTRIEMSLSLDVRMRLLEKAEEESITVFAANLRDLLLAAPAGGRPTLALDPGFRTGVKVAAIDATGKVVDHATIYPHEPMRRWDDSLRTLASLVRRHKIEIIAVGNATASRETDQLAGELIKSMPDHALIKVMVSEAGASVYSASEYASRELPDLDVTIRGAVSIGRRLQDPLAELVKVPPRSIGVGSYQHDVSEYRLDRTLDAVVEDVVNKVGVDVNSASAKLLARVSGIGEFLAESIVQYRDTHGAFKSREELRNVPRLGPKTFEQCAGFLRIRDGENPLDSSCVHPEAYPVVRKVLEATKSDIRVVMGNPTLLRKLKPQQFVDDAFGLLTVKDILTELEKPGRDPRPAFRAAEFKAGIEKITDLEPGMILEGTVSNVAPYGAFVNVGVGVDGLVHVTAMAKTFVKDPRSIAKPGDIVSVKVMKVDVPRKRIELTMRLDDPLSSDTAGNDFRPASKSMKAPKATSTPSSNPFAEAFAKAGMTRR
ncbi:Tex family protein [Bosea sp. RAC05]|uniref:Tex family protein n=1 Tax=Bosea sp. RAC05 TaxID=1842539 RepID=UPI00083D08DC|nr:Tex family protein [Bosea sp. RAC05]AOG02796.1 S1 RNA binding domain protein [Bosea sp. RAC05]